jgi:hypothetical protein
VEIPEALSPKFCRGPSSTWASHVKKLPHAKGRARCHFTKDVLKPRMIVQRVMDHFPILLSFPEAGVEAVFWIHGDVEMWAERAGCT